MGMFGWSPLQVYLDKLENKQSVHPFAERWGSPSNITALIRPACDRRTTGTSPSFLSYWFQPGPVPTIQQRCTPRLHWTLSATCQKGVWFVWFCLSIVNVQTGRRHWEEEQLRKHPLDRERSKEPLQSNDNVEKSALLVSYPTLSRVSNGGTQRSMAYMDVALAKKPSWERILTHSTWIDRDPHTAVISLVASYLFSMLRALKVKSDQSAKLQKEAESKRSEDE